jgi:hypothetical protein
VALASLPMNIGWKPMPRKNKDRRRLSTCGGGVAP